MKGRRRARDLHVWGTLQVRGLDVSLGLGAPHVSLKELLLREDKSDFGKTAHSCRMQTPPQPKVG